MARLPLVVLASARKQSDTRAFVTRVFPGADYELIDLLDYSISPYSYENDYPDNDQFPKIIEAILSHNAVVFATPVYWYAMSGIMKTFFDRLTDLVTVKKHLGRQLRGKSAFLIAVGADEELPGGFEIPFKLTSGYLDMKYQGCIYYSTKFPKTQEGLQEICKAFRNKVRNIGKPEQGS